MSTSYQQILSKDKKLQPLLLQQNFELELRQNIPIVLMKSIMSQQLSTKVADVIYKRFLALFNTKNITCKNVLEIDVETYRSVGLSYQKCGYITNVAQFFIDHKLTDAKIYAMSNEEILSTLTQIKGVGKWTVEMLLMFALQRENIFSVDDLGIQQGMEMLYKISSENKKEMKLQMEKIAIKWQPYQTFACLHIWHWKDAMKKNNLKN